MAPRSNGADSHSMGQRAQVKKAGVSYILHDEMPGSELEYRDNPGKSGMVGS